VRRSSMSRSRSSRGGTLITRCSPVMLCFFLASGAL
jgi:hypothetical protein